MSAGVFGCSGHLSARRALADETVQLILAAGTNLGEWSTSKWDPLLMNDKLIHIHSDRTCFARSPMARLHVQGKIGAIFTQLNDRVAMLRRSGEAAHSPVEPGDPEAAARAGYLPANITVHDPACCRPGGAGRPIKPPHLFAELIRRLPRETRFFIDNSNSVPWSTRLPGIISAVLFAVRLSRLVASGASITQAMDVATAVMYMVSVAALYGFVRVLGRNRLIAVATAVVVLAAPVLWSASIQAGSYPRLCAMAFGDVAIFVAALDARRPTRVHAVVIALLLGVAMGSHPVIGVLVVFQVACVLAVVPQAPFEQRMRRLAMILVAVAGLSAWYYVPYFLHPSSYYLQAAQSALVVGTPAEFRTLLVVPTGGQYVGSSILALPAVLVPLRIAIGAWITVLLWRPVTPVGSASKSPKDSRGGNAAAAFPSR